MLKKVLIFNEALKDIKDIIRNPREYVELNKEKGWDVFVTKTVRLYLLLEILAYVISFSFFEDRAVTFNKTIIINLIWGLVCPLVSVVIFSLVGAILRIKVSCLEVFYYCFMFRIIILFPIYLIYCAYFYTENVYIFMGNTWLYYLTFMVYMAGFGCMYTRSIFKKIASAALALFLVYLIGYVTGGIDKYAYVYENTIHGMPIYDPISLEFSETLEYYKENISKNMDIFTDFSDLHHAYAKIMIEENGKSKIEAPSVKKEYKKLMDEKELLLDSINIVKEKKRFYSSQRLIEYLLEIVRLHVREAEYGFQAYECLRAGDYDKAIEKEMQELEIAKKINKYTNNSIEYIKSKTRDIEWLLQHDRVWFLKTVIM